MNVNSSNPIESKQKYQDYVDKKSPNSPILKNCPGLIVIVSPSV